MKDYICVCRHRWLLDSCSDPTPRGRELGRCYCGRELKIGEEDGRATKKSILV